MSKAQKGQDSHPKQSSAREAEEKNKEDISRVSASPKPIFVLCQYTPHQTLHTTAVISCTFPSHIYL